MDNKKIPTWLGTVIIIIFAATAGAFVWMIAGTPQKLINTKTPATTQNSTNQQNQLPNNNQSKQSSKSAYVPACLEQNQPTIPTTTNELGKSPGQLLKDFYDWYIGNNNYKFYQIYALNQRNDVINLGELTKNSFFITSSYDQNMKKREGNFDPVLCTQDTVCNVVKNYDDVQISGNSASVNILRGYLDSYADAYTESSKIQVKLKKEDNQWKIDDIICGSRTK